MEASAAPHRPSPCRIPGFSFIPTDEELVVYYLRRHISGEALPEGFVVPADVYDTEPWKLVGEGQEEGYFFARRVRTGGKAKRPSRTAGAGSWQTFKKDEEVKSEADGNGLVTVGVKHCLSFKFECNKNTGWIMYEYVLGTHDYGDEGSFQERVLCHIKKSEQSKKRTRDEGARGHLHNKYVDTRALIASYDPTLVVRATGSQEEGEVMLVPPAQIGDQVQQQQQLPLMTSWSGYELALPHDHHENSMITATNDHMQAKTDVIVDEVREFMDRETQEWDEFLTWDQSKIDVTVEEVLAFLDQETSQECNEFMTYEQSSDQRQQGNQLMGLEHGSAATTFSPSWIRRCQLEQLPLATISTDQVMLSRNGPPAWEQGLDRTYLIDHVDYWTTQN